MERQKVLSLAVPSTAETNLSVEGQGSAGCAPRRARSKTGVRGRGAKPKVLAFASPRNEAENPPSGDERRNLEDGLDCVLIEACKRVSFGDGLTVALSDALMLRHILPARLMNAVVIGGWILEVLVHVKKIQREIGIRASILLADLEFLRQRPGPDGFKQYLRDRQPVFGFEKALESHALRMKKDSRFQPVLRAADDQLLKVMERCGFWSVREAKDRVEFIVEYALQEYDTEVGTYAVED